VAIIDEAGVAVRADFSRFDGDVQRGGAAAAETLRRAFTGGPPVDPLPNLDQAARAAAEAAAQDAVRAFRSNFNPGEGAPPDPLPNLDEVARRAALRAAQDAAAAFTGGFRPDGTPNPLPDLDAVARAAAAAAAADAARAFRNGFDDGGGGPPPNPLEDLSSRTTPEAEGAGSESNKGFFSRFREGGKEGGSAFGEEVLGALPALGWAAAGVAVAALFVEGFTAAADLQAANSKLQAQLGITKEEAGKYGKEAGALYAQNYGESIEDIEDTIASAINNIGGFSGAADPALQQTVKYAQDLASTFDIDVSESTRAAGQLIKTGLADNSKEAFDIITAGFQKGANASDDYIDTLTEYGTQFRKLGIDGQTATGLISQGLKAGARDGDLVADAIKEFSIRAIDGSTSTKTAFEALGVSAEDMQARIAKGGDSASGALEQTFTLLRGVKDPAEQAAIATGLFGTQAEDLGAALYSLDPSTAVDALGQVAGAADQMDTALGDTAQARIESFKRSISVGFTNVAGGILGFFDDVLTAVAPVTDAIKSFVTGGIDPLANAAGPISALGASLAATFGPALSGAFAAIKDAVTQIDFSGLVSSFQGLVAAGSGLAQTLLPPLQELGTAILGTVGPAFQALGSIIGAVFQVIVGIVQTGVTVITALFNSGFGQGLLTVVTSVFGAVIGVIQGAFTVLTGLFNVIAGLLTGNWQQLWDGILQIFQGIGIAVIAVAEGLVGALGGIFASIGAVITGIWNALWAGITTVVSVSVDAVVGFVSGLAASLTGSFASLGASISSATSTAWNTITSVVSAGINAVKAAIAAFVAAEIAGFTLLWNTAKQLASDAWNAIKSTVTAGVSAVIGFVNNLGSTVKSTFTDAWNTAKSIVSGAISTIQSTVSSGVSAVLGVIRALPGQVTSALSSFGSLLVERGSALMSGLRSGVTGGIGAVLSAVGGIPGQVRGALGSVGSTLYSAGIDLIQGMVNGVRAAAGRIASAAAQVVSSAVSAAKNAVGIHSPSTVMRDEVGRMMSLGLAQGIAAEAGAVAGALDDIVSSVASTQLTVPRVTLAGVSADTVAAAGGSVVAAGRSGGQSSATTAGRQVNYNIDASDRSDSEIIDLIRQKEAVDAVLYANA